MRSWRRGMKEMDLILGPFSDTELPGLTDDEVDLYETMLNENDQDLYLWVTARLSGEHPGPAQISALLDRIADFAAARLTPKS
ncbi:succinate dehydrogenase assembly factor 2 [Paracoccus laeviglucosivorans]|nr:succinate dehydrogenase assembly factor 2 [Paracoccus laeviglucosivorans]